MNRLDQLFQQFLRERTYITNVTSKTLTWYESAGKAFKRAQSSAPPRPTSALLISKTDLQAFVVHLRQRGAKPVTCNTWLRALNAFCHWLHEQGEIAAAVKLAPQRLEKRIVRTHDEAALRAILTYRPKTFAHGRIHVLVSTILDTGCRIEEVLTARTADFDFGNLLLTVYGKGRKERRVPFSLELRKMLFRFGQFKERAGIPSELMFPSREGGRWEQRNALRSLYCLLKRLGLPRSGFHRLRHTFATQYLRHGGDVVRLSIILGHSEVSTTMKYLHLLTEDLQRPHQGLSILYRLR
jgi:site-specific recombinase XerD